MTGRRRAVVVVLLGMLSGLLGGLLLAGPSAQAQPTGRVITINIVDFTQDVEFAFEPDDEAITVGDTIAWVNKDSNPHTVRSTSGPAPFTSPVLQRGDSWSYTFMIPGHYRYASARYPSMAGHLVVADAAGPAAPHVDHDAVTVGPPAAPAGSDSTAPVASLATRSMPGPALQASPQPAEETLDPMLVVAGICVGVAVFSLLLLASRPRPDDRNAG